ncbi:MAG: cytochrome c [Chlorobi bacterium]|nr:cytochrome c [Chlorobiota bacterium]
MKNIKTLSAFVILTAVIIVSVSSFASNNKVKTTKAGDISFVIPHDDPAAAKFPEGAKIFQQKCVPCHQVTGLGIPGAFPPLKNSDYLLADKKRAVKQVLNGSNHEITVNGQKYNVPMPPQVDNYQDAVNVINYVLNAWGNNGGTVTVDEVKDIKIVR